MIVLLSPAFRGGAGARAAGSAESQDATARQAQPPAQGQETPSVPSSAIAAYEGRIVQSIQLPEVPDHDREHLLQLLTHRAGEPLDRDKVLERILALFATARFPELQPDMFPPQ